MESTPRIRNRRPDTGSLPTTTSASTWSPIFTYATSPGVSVPPRAVHAPPCDATPLPNAQNESASPTFSWGQTVAPLGRPHCQEFVWQWQNVWTRGFILSVVCITPLAQQVLGADGGRSLAARLPQRAGAAHSYDGASSLCLATLAHMLSGAAPRRPCGNPRTKTRACLNSIRLNTLWLSWYEERRRRGGGRMDAIA